MRRYGDYDLNVLHREAERLRAQAARAMVVALLRKVRALFGGKSRMPHGGRPAGV